MNEYRTLGSEEKDSRIRNFFAGKGQKERRWEINPTSSPCPRLRHIFNNPGRRVQSNVGYPPSNMVLYYRPPLVMDGESHV